MEWMIWMSAIKTDQETAKFTGDQSFVTDPCWDGHYAETLAEDKARMDAERFPRAFTTSPVYACNDTYLEMRCGGMENRRGFVTLFVFAWFYFIWMFADSALLIIGGNIQDDWRWIFPFSITGGTVVILVFLFLKFGITIWRWEAFTTRHLLIRFNRITRQVYVHRPKNCGDIVIMPWEGIMHTIQAPYPLGLAWVIQDGENVYPNVAALVGKTTPIKEELQASWEFIRRYMDEGGLSAIEKPEITSRFPWPWAVFKTQIEGMEVFLQVTVKNPLFLIGYIMILPIVIILVLCHWISLLLCWPPRWPKIILEAGQAGKPMPKISEIDDYPPKIAAKLKANAERWRILPGKKPRRQRKKTEKPAG
jgi:hypothetical protein